MTFPKTKTIKKQQKNAFIFLFCFIFFSFLPVIKTQAARQMDGVAFITNKNGQPVSGSYSVRFAIYSKDRTTSDSYPSDSDRSTRVWEETQAIEVENGILQFTLGQNQDLPILEASENNQFYLGIRINEDAELVPRKKITANLFTYNAMNATLLNGRKIGTGSGDIIALGANGQIDIQNLPIGTGKNQIITGNDSRLDNTLTVSGSSYLTLSSQKLTVNKIKLGSDTQGTLAVAQGGTGLTTTPESGKVLMGTGSGYAFGSILGAGNVNVATTSSNISISLKDTISVDNLTISGTVPSDVTDHLYKSGTDLYWSGTNLSSGGVSYTKSGTLLQLTGTTFSLKEGTLTDNKICTYSSTNGLVCNTDPSSAGTETDPVFVASSAYGITAGHITTLGNTSGTNTGDNAVNSLYSGLATSKQDALSGTGFVKITGTTISYDNSTYVTGTPWTSMGYLTGTKVDSFNTRTGAVTLSGTDVTTALTFTPYNATNPNNYLSTVDISANTNLAVSGTLLSLTGDTLSLKEGTLTPGRLCTYDGTNLVCNTTSASVGHTAATISATPNGLAIDGSQQISLALSTTSTTGALSSTDWNTFNNKQPAGSYLTSFTETDPRLPASGTSGNLLQSNGTVWASWTPNYLTANQTITLSGDVTGSGATAIATTIGADKITESMLVASATPSSGNVLTYNGTNGFTWVATAPGTAHNLFSSTHADMASITPAQGDIIYYNGTSWTALTAGTNGNYLKTQGVGANPTWNTPSGTVYTAGGTLLQLNTNTFSIKEGTLTDTKYCKYVSGTGIVCNYDAGGVTYTAANGITLNTGAFELGGALTKNTEIALAGFNLNFTGTGNIGIGTTTPSYKLDVRGTAAAGQINAEAGLCINGVCKTSWSDAGIGTDTWTTTGSDIYFATGNVGIGTTSPSALFAVGSTSQFQVNSTGNVTGGAYNALTLTAATTGFTIAGGTTSKTLTISNTLTLSGTDSSTLDIGTGGTLGTGAYATIANYAPIGQTMYIGTTAHAINRGTGAEVLAGITGLTPGANFVLTQNSVAALTSEETGAVANTLYLKTGNVGIGTTAPGALLQLGTASKLGTLGLAGSTSGMVTIQPAATAGTWTMTLPATAGTNGYALTTNGSGVMGWTSIGGGSLPSGTTGQTVYHNGSAWASTSTIYNDGTHVGIGTNNPGSYQLAVGTGATANQFLVSTAGLATLPGGAANAPSLSFATGGINTGIWSSATNILNFSTNSAERMRIDANGFVGIQNTGTLPELLTIGASGSGGRVVLYDSSQPGTITNKLWAVSGNLYWGGSSVINLTSGLNVSGTSNQTLRYNSGASAWEASSTIYNDGTHIGIGTASPDGNYRMTIGSSGTPLYINDDGKVYHSAGVANSPSLTFKNNDNTGIWSSATNFLNFSTNSAERMRIDSSGNVGIGTVTTSNYKLDIQGNGASGQINANGGLCIAGSCITSWGSIGSNLTFTPGSNTYIENNYNTGDSMVNIQNTNAVYTANLWVEGTISSGTTNYFGVHNALQLPSFATSYIENNYNTSDSVIAINNTNAVYTANLWVEGTISSGSTNFSGVHNALQLPALATSYIENNYNTSDSVIAINNTNTTYTANLWVEGTISSGSTNFSGVHNALQLPALATSYIENNYNNSDSIIAINNTNTTYKANLWVEGAITSGPTTNALQLPAANDVYIENSHGASSTFSIRNSNATYVTNLWVEGTIASGSTTNALQLPAAASVYIEDDNGADTTFTIRNRSGYTGHLAVEGSINSGTLNSNGAVYSNGGTLTNTNPSDERLKHNILSLDSSVLDKVLKLRPVSFAWNSNNQPALGFIAQEVEGVIPELVGQGLNGYKGLYTDQFIPYLTKAIQEQQSQIIGINDQFSSLSSAFHITDSSGKLILFGNREIGALQNRDMTLTADVINLNGTILANGQNINTAITSLTNNQSKIVSQLTGQLADQTLTVDNKLQLIGASLDALTTEQIEKLKDQIIDQTSDIYTLETQMADIQLQNKAFNEFLLAFDVKNIDNFAKLNAPLNIFAGKIIASDIEVLGIAKAETLDGQKLKLGAQVSGTSLIKAGELESAKILTTEAKAGIKLYITPKGSTQGKILYYDEVDIDSGVGFKVKIEAPALDKDVEFNWLIVK